MPVTHTSRTGRTYYLHIGPKRGGGFQHYFSTKTEGTLAGQLPEGFELYENIDGKVFLRRHQPKLIREDEYEWIAGRLAEKTSGDLRFKAEVQGKSLTIHQSVQRLGSLERFGISLKERDYDRFASYQAVLRFVLVDEAPDRRLFAPERYCFRGSVDDWISVGKPDSIKNLAATFLKHLGTESLYELF